MYDEIKKDMAGMREAAEGKEDEEELRIADERKAEERRFQRKRGCRRQGSRSIRTDRKKAAGSGRPEKRDQQEEKASPGRAAPSPAAAEA
jgi:hypothetical protein